MTTTKNQLNFLIEICCCTPQYEDIDTCDFLEYSDEK